MSLVRLNKYLASIGIASRRHVDLLISQGNITINNSIAKLGAKINPSSDIIKLNNKVVRQSPPKIYIMLNKTDRTISSTHDDHGRTSILDLVKSPIRLFPVGRLDYHTTGLIILTNDGDFALKLTHPRFHLAKTYLVTTRYPTPQQSLNQLELGVHLADGLTAPAKVKILSPTVFEITIYQGKNRQIRRMCQEVGIDLESLHRLSIGSLKLNNLPLGQFRHLTPSEIKQLLTS